MGKGSWKHPQIPDPEWEEVKDPQKRKPINFVAFDLWQVKSGTLFSNLLVTDNEEEAEAARWSKDDFSKEKENKEAYDKAQSGGDEEEEDEDEEEGDSAEDEDEEGDMAELEDDAEEESVGHDE